MRVTSSQVAILLTTHALVSTMSVVATSRPPGGGAGRLLRRIVILLLVLLLLPYAIAVLYRVVTPVSTPMLWRWITGQRVERIFVPLGMMQPSLPLAVIAAEDARFC